MVCRFYILCVFFEMKINSIFVILLAFWYAFLAWCSMMPDDEEIIKWSILENEIFWEEFSDEVLNAEELIGDETENVQNNDELVENVEEEEDGSTEIQVEVAE